MLAPVLRPASKAQVPQGEMPVGVAPRSCQTQAPTRPDLIPYFRYWIRD
jgi:hypothetical protein